MESSQSHRFHEACEAMKRSAAKFKVTELSSESEEEEEDINETEVIEKTLSNYTEGGAEGQDLRKVREVLIEVLSAGAVVCLVCIEAVRRRDQVWSCKSCFCLLHLHCIQKWAKDSLLQQASSTLWRCPKCRSEYPPSDRPTSYICFCGKEKDPPCAPTWGVPHACSSPCEKKLGCGHICRILCHPGPCPPCPQTVTTSCCCGRSPVVQRRCSAREWVCGRVCDRPLACSTHTCQEPCHRGSCAPCERESSRHCACGAATLRLPCSATEVQCERVCGRLLSCRNHTCALVCHKQPCPQCPDSGPRTCPCGKNAETVPCTEEVSPCGDTCDRLLVCGLHRCSQRCHPGPCEQCLQMRVMRCRCGQRERSVACCKEFLCDIKCRNRRDCGRHNCNRKCCIGSCPPCELPCAKTLGCGKHKCASVCHPGPCFPCRETIQVSCSCGHTKATFPCGRRKDAPPPRCTAQCRLPADCHHPTRHLHRCHPGSCPPCRLPCSKEMPCGHVCPTRCHSAVLTKVDLKQKKSGPWDLQNSFLMKLVCRPCPPCLEPMPVTCPGGHETVLVPCHQAVSTSCGRKCGRALPCTNHKCERQCHSVEEQECDQCSESCLLTRPCIHLCPRPCHPGVCAPCAVPLKMRCHCGLGAVWAPCGEWQGEKKPELSCSNTCPRELVCGHRCPLSCHAGGCPPRQDCRRRVTQRCPCKRRRRDASCAAASASPLRCDEECEALRGARDTTMAEEELRRRREEEEALLREVEEFEKKAAGGKRRRRKEKSGTEPGKKGRGKGFVFAAAAALLAAGCAAIYCLLLT